MIKRAKVHGGNLNKTKIFMTTCKGNRPPSIKSRLLRITINCVQRLCAFFSFRIYSYPIGGP